MSKSPSARMIFFGTPQFAVPALNLLINNGFPLVGVVTQPDRPAGRKNILAPSPVKNAALQADVQLFQPVSLRDSQAHVLISAWKPTIGIVVAYGNLLPKAVLKLFPEGVLNLHPSLLPKYRGPSPIQTAILNGDTMTGVTLMQLDCGMDTGPLYAQKIEPIQETDTAVTLGQRLAEAGARLLCECLPNILSHTLHPSKQDDRNATITKLLTKENGTLDWDQSAKQVDRRVRAMAPWPGAWTQWESHDHTKRLRIHILEGIPETKPMIAGASIGTFIATTSPLTVQTGEGQYLIKKLQREGRQSLSAEEFLRGQKDFQTGSFT